MSSSETTTDHDEIRRWVESRNGRPAVVKGTEGKDGEGILRVEFRHGDKLEDIEWDEFFQTFDDRKLAFLYQDKTSDGKQSRFFKFVKRNEDR
jgi:glutathione synthase/RimK-type ligase-like ATP-grasp enzyme